MDIPGYRIERELGRGGMATVYLAEQLKFERKVALKVMAPTLNSDPSFKERFVREAKLVANLSHPHIVAVYDVGEHDGQVYMAMEYHTGGDLKARIRQGMTPAQVVRVTADIARALEFAHAKGVVHRDIKPDNILFRTDGSAVLTDFGIAKQGDAKTQFTQMGLVAGTPKYMSPEQARGLPLDAESDLYSLGIVLYEMLTGDVPFAAEDSIALAIKHLKDPVPPLPAPLRRFQPVLDRLLAKEPAKRYHRGGELAQVLEQMLASGALRDVANKPLAPAGATQVRAAVTAADLQAAGAGRRRGLVAGALAVLVLAGGGGAWYFLAGPGAPVPEPVAEVPPALPPEPAPVVEAEVAAEPVAAVEAPAGELVAEVPAAPPAPEPAAPVQPVAPAQPAVAQPPAFDPAPLLAEAGLALAADRLTEPEDDNAVALYRAVLEQDPKNKLARQGLRRVVDRQVVLIDRALDNGNVDKATRLLRAVEGVIPNYAPLADAATRIATADAARTAAAAPPPAPVVEEAPVPGADPNAARNRLRAKGLANKGASLLRQNDYVAARRHFEEALALDPENAAARDGMERLQQLGL